MFRHFDFLGLKDLVTWFLNILSLSVPDEGYSRNASCALSFISTFLSLVYNEKEHQVSYLFLFLISDLLEGLRGRDHMVVRFLTTYAISAYHHLRCKFESH